MQVMIACISFCGLFVGIDSTSDADKEDVILYCQKNLTN